MSRISKINGFALYPQHLDYLNKLYDLGYNKSAIVRKAIELHEETSNLLQRSEVDPQGGLND